MLRSLEQLVWTRAQSSCEYCRLLSSQADLLFEIDHVIARKHGGLTEPEILALSCSYRNSYKGPNIAGIDSASGEVTRLFHPRCDSWNDHFRWDGGVLMGITGVGRATIDVLMMNHPLVVERRELLIKIGMFPPTI